MDTIRDLLQEKRYRPLCITHPGVTVLEATQLMNDERIGALLVMHGPRLVGIFTERDVLRRVVADGRNPETTLVAEVMTDDLVCCEPDTPVDDVAETMRRLRIRHGPLRRSRPLRLPRSSPTPRPAPCPCPRPRPGRASPPCG